MAIQDFCQTYAITLILYSQVKCVMGCTHESNSRQILSSSSFTVSLCVITFLHLMSETKSSDWYMDTFS